MAAMVGWARRLASCKHLTRTPDRREPDPRLVALLAKAYDWFTRRSSGEINGLQSRALQENVSSSYVVRVVQLAILAPEIALAIAQGHHPPTLRARRLMRSVAL